MAGVNNLQSSESGGTVTLTWSNGAWAYYDCGSPSREWRAFRRVKGTSSWGSAIWSQALNSNRNAYTATTDSPPSGDIYEYKVESRDYKAIDIDGNCTYSYSNWLGQEVEQSVGVADDFDLGTSSRVPLNTYIQSAAILVGGSASSYSISVSGGNYAVSTDGGSSWGAWASTNGNVDVGDFVKVRVLSSSSYNTNTSCTLTIGGTSDSFLVTTYLDPVLDLIKTPVSLPINLRADVFDVFGGDGLLTDYVRNDTVVPDIAYNDVDGHPGSGGRSPSLQTSPPIDLSDLLDRAAVYAWSFTPSNKSDGANTIGVVGNVSVSWAINSDFSLLYASNDVTDWKWDVSISHSNINNPATVIISPSDYNTFANDNTTLSLSASGGPNFEDIITCDVMLTAKHKTKIGAFSPKTATFRGRLVLYGP